MWILLYLYRVKIRILSYEFLRDLFYNINPEAQASTTPLCYHITRTHPLDLLCYF